MTASPPQRLRLYAERDGRGRLRTTYLLENDATLSLAYADSDADAEAAAPSVAPPTLHSVGPVSHLALRMVFSRYGRPLEPGLDLAAHAAQEHADDRPLRVLDPAGPAATLLRFRYKPFGWVYPADYLLFTPDAGEALAAEAPLVSAALQALAQAAQARAGRPT